MARGSAFPALLALAPLLAGCFYSEETLFADAGDKIPTAAGPVSCLTYGSATDASPGANQATLVQHDAGGGHFTYTLVDADPTPTPMVFFKVAGEASGEVFIGSAPEPQIGGDYFEVVRATPTRLTSFVIAGPDVESLAAAKNVTLLKEDVGYSMKGAAADQKAFLTAVALAPGTERWPHLDCTVKK